ncbi:hypothetical protein BG000_004601 [Podila horticola]|nr:hypothetical protein BG000_004601 [Podila horticola]
MKQFSNLLTKLQIMKMLTMIPMLILDTIMMVKSQILLHSLTSLQLNIFKL